MALSSARIQAFTKRGNPNHDPKTGKFSSGKSGKPSGTPEKKMPNQIKGRVNYMIIPSAKNAKKREKMKTYMEGFHNRLKNPNERKYAAARSHQMINGIPRPHGMSAKYGLTKHRAMQYEGLIYRIFLSGRNKHNV